MKEGKLSNSDVTRNFIVLDKSVHSLFKRFVGHQLKIVDQDDCDFFFDVKKYANGQLFLTQTQGFIEQWNLKEGDEISFEYDDEIGAFVVNTKGNDNSQVAEKPSCTKATSTDEKTNISKTITETYQSVVDTYRNTFKENHYLPTKKSNSSLVINGFTERNLTFNFCHSYLVQHPNAIVWQEIPIDDVNRQHVDSIIIDNDWVIYIEAKRLYDVTHFKNLLDDFDRIKKRHSRITLPPKYSSYKKVVVLLADHYCIRKGNNAKKDQKENYFDQFFGGKDVIMQFKIENDYPNLSNRINSTKITNVCSIKNPTIDICGGQYNINVEDDLDYTIYCGVYFIDEMEKK